MKKIFFTLLGLLMITSVSAEENEYVPLVREGVMWVEYYNNTIDNTQRVTTYHFSGNIEIGGFYYSKLYRTDNTQDNRLIAFVREQNKKVYIIPNNIGIDECVITNQYLGEYIIYDFNNITAPYTIDESFMQPVTIEQMSYGDNTVNVYNLGGAKRIAEGIGCLDYVFYNPWPMILPDGSHYSLAWFEDNGEIIYKGEDYDAAVDYLSNQTKFKPVLTEGKSWEVATISWDYENFPNSNDTTGYYTVSVSGDTIVNDLTCKKIKIVPNDNQKSSKTAVAYEKDGKVWNVKSDGEMELIFDIGHHLYDAIDNGYVIEEDSVRINGEYRKRLCVDSGVDCDDYFYYIVEGIGISSDKWLSFPRLSIGNENEYTCMLYCCENGDTIFTKKDFSKQNNYVPLVREGVVWEYVGFRQNENNSYQHSLYSLEFNGTTTIDGKLYHNIYRTDYDKQGNAQEPYFVANVREENKVVSVYNNGEGENFIYNYWWWIPETLYDFSKPMFLPDEAYIVFYNDAPYDYDTNYITYSSIEVEVGETTRNGYFINNGNDDQSFKTIEGIGVDCDFGDLLVPYRTYTTGFNPMATLAAVYENGELVYKGRAYDKAQRLKNPIMGDVNDDGFVTSADITALYDYLLNSDFENYETSDVDGDGSVTSADVTAVYNILLGE